MFEFNDQRIELIPARNLVNQSPLSPQSRINIYPGGPQITEKAKQIAARLGKADFKRFNWMDGEVEKKAQYHTVNSLWRIRYTGGDS